VQSTYVKFGLWPWTKVDESAAVKAKVARRGRSMVMEGPEVVGKGNGDKERLNKRLGLALSIKNRSFGGSGGDKVPKNTKEHRLTRQSQTHYLLPAAPSLTAVPSILSAIGFSAVSANNPALVRMHSQVCFQNQRKRMGRGYHRPLRPCVVTPPTAHALIGHGQGVTERIQGASRCQSYMQTLLGRDDRFL
jgi:hypothetical protein